MDRQAAWELLCQYTKSESLRKHALAVEACMRAYARRFGEDEEKWGVVGLIHDFDYELYPNAPDHPLKGSEILTERGYPEEPGKEPGKEPAAKDKDKDKKSAEKPKGKPDNDKPPADKSLDKPEDDSEKAERDAGRQQQAGRG